LAAAFARNRADFTSLAAAAWQRHSNITLASRVLILFPFQISRDGGRRRFYAIAAPVAPHHSEDPSPSDPPFQRCLQSDTRNYLQSPCQRKASSKLALVSSTPGARYRSARDNQRSLSALIICMLGCVELLTASGGSYRGHGDSAVWHVLSMYSRVYWHVVVCIGM